MRCLVTGGAGFIGSRLVHRLCHLGHEVDVIDDLSSGNMDSLNGTNASGHIIDIATQPEKVEALMARMPFDWVFHLAARPRVQLSIAKPLTTNHHNIDGTLLMLELAKQFRVKRFIFSSSSSVYGDQDSLPLREDMRPNPMSPYALQKLTGERYAKLYHDLYELPTVSLRYFNVYGPTQKEDAAYAAAIPKWVAQAHRGEPITVFGDGEQRRDFTHVEDVVTANIMAAISPEWCNGQVYNVGYGRDHSVNELIGYMLPHLPRETAVKYGDAVVEARATRADTRKATRGFSFVARRSLRKEIGPCVREILQKLDRGGLEK